MSSYVADERVLEAVALTNALSVASTFDRQCDEKTSVLSWVYGGDVDADFEAVSKLAMRVFGSDKSNKRQLARTAGECAVAIGFR